MIEIDSKVLKQSLVVDRIIGKVDSGKPGPTLVFFAGIHGNEVAGVFALKKVFDELDKFKGDIRGKVYGVSGNLKALASNKRYIHQDLNRLWTKSNIKKIATKEELSNEEEELVSLMVILEKILKDDPGPYYFIDLHTTSSKTLPFITINDALINRKFSAKFPVPIILGIEEFLEGPMLSYINQLGYVAVGFESGQHDEEAAITNNIAFIFLALVFARLIKKKSLPEFETYFKQLENASGDVSEIYEIIYLHRILNGEHFNMLPGFESFETVNEGTPLAISDGLPIESQYTARLFMPLYQKLGNDGFFLIRSIPPFALKLSSFLRKIKFDNLLVWLPGIQWESREKEILRVDLNTAKYFTGPLFHLLGYRIRVMDENYIRLYNREHAAKTEIYRGEKWY